MPFRHNFGIMQFVVFFDVFFKNFVEKKRTMKKTIIPVLLMLSFFSCQKTEKIQNTNHDSTAVLLDKKDANNNTYLITIMMGHPASGCKGCVMMYGRLIHIDCMGDGNECVNSSTVNLVQISANDYTATTLDSTALTTEDFFLMPDRSLLTEDEKGQPIYLNIPAQLVFRDSVSRQFTFNNLYYSNTQVYDNE